MCIIPPPPVKEFIPEQPLQQMVSCTDIATMQTLMQLLIVRRRQALEILEKNHMENVKGLQLIEKMNDKIKQILYV